MAALKDVRVLELAALATTPFTGMFLADYGASVLRVDRAGPTAAQSPDNLVRHKSSITLDLKSSAGRHLFMDLLGKTDVLLDPYRPGVLERMRLDPKMLVQQYPRLIVARLTGFRRSGEYATMAGHDLNYLAVSGVLAILGPSDVLADGRVQPPSPPGNLLGDMAAGGLMCVAGILMALHHRSVTGNGQVVENNMVDGTSYIATMSRVSRHIPGQWDKPRGENLVDGACPYYNVYECKDDGTYMAVAALEPVFWAAFCKGFGISENDWAGKREDRKMWPKIKSLLQEKFRSRTQSEWEAIFKGTDACCTAVLTYDQQQAEGYNHQLPIHLTRSEGIQLPTGKDQWEMGPIANGEGGEKVLKEWLGYRKDDQYLVKKGVFEKVGGSKL